VSAKSGEAKRGGQLSSVVRGENFSRKEQNQKERAGNWVEIGRKTGAKKRMWRVDHSAKSRKRNKRTDEKRRKNIFRKKRWGELDSKPWWPKPLQGEKKETALGRNGTGLGNGSRRTEIDCGKGGKKSLWAPG